MTDVNEEVFGAGTPEGTPPTPEQVVAQPPEGEKVDAITELVASSDEAPAVPEETPPVEPTDDAKKAETEAFYQTKYQTLLATLDKDAPAPVLGQPGLIPPATPPVAPVAPVIPVVQPPVQDEDEYRQLIKAEIQAGFTEMRGQQEAQQLATAEAQFMREEKSAGAELSKFAADTGITQEQLNEAYNVAQDMGIPYSRIGGPTAYVKFIAKHLDHERRINGPTPQEVTTLAAAEQKVLTDAMVAQPNMATPGAPVALSRDDQILDIMQKAGSNDATKEVFG